MDLVEELKSKLNIMDVVQDFGIVIGRNNFISSIYKEEENPSLKLYPQTNSYYDFSAGKGGDVINFYAEYKKISNGDAIKELSEKYYIRTEKSIQKMKTIDKPKLKIQLLESEIYIFDEAAGKYEYENNSSKKEAEELAYKDVINERRNLQINIYEKLAEYCNGIDHESYEYLCGKKRGLSKETLMKFRIFTIHNLQKTIEFLKDTFEADELKISGLFNNKDNFVFHNHKIIIPYIEDGKIVYLRGRYLKKGDSDEKNGFKYISPTNFAGNLTSKRLYNWDELKKMKKDFELIICEGEFDTMLTTQAGFKAVGIPGVTNFPNRYIKELERYSIYLAFDSDEAGQKAMNQMAKLFNKRILGIKLKKHKDLTEYIIDATKH